MINHTIVVTLIIGLLRLYNESFCVLKYIIYVILTSICYTQNAAIRNHRLPLQTR